MQHWKLLLIGSLALTAACSRKAEQLPPQPPSRTDATAPTTESAPQQDLSQASVRPGSLEDFQRSVTSDRIRFGYDSYELDGSARGILDSQVQWLQKYPAVRVRVEGHADERGTREYNLALGERRANEIRTYLVAQGVPGERVTTISYGKERPEVEGADDDSFARNRRGVTVPSEGLTS